MWVSRRHLLALLTVALLSLVGRPARAWVETQLQSSVITIEVGRDGAGVVRHELMMRVRGGPLQSFQLDGIDADAVLLPDASALPILRSGVAGEPVALLAERTEDNSLRLEVDGKGLRGGTYLFKVGYRTQLLERNALSLKGARAELAWVGPRFTGGLDGAKVILRFPAAPAVPALVQLDREQAALGLAEDPGGVFVATVRHQGGWDEIELTRPHIAQGEPVVWRVSVAPEAFDAFRGVSSAPQALPEIPSAPRRAEQLAAVIGLGLAYALLAGFKRRQAARAAQARGAVVRGLVPGPWWLGAGLAGVAVAGAAASVLWLDGPLVPGLALCAAMALAMVLTPRVPAPPRGPGRWLVLRDDEVYAEPAPQLPGVCMDAGTGRGFLCFVAALGLIVALGSWDLTLAPYRGLWIMLGSALLVPIFFTGRARELPIDAVTEPRRLYAWLTRELRARHDLKVVAWARIPSGASEPDELRLLVRPVQPLRGLSALEIAMEYSHAAGGAAALPCVVVRAREGSSAHAALPRSASWTRGRQAEERVCILRPRLPTRAMLLSLVERLSTLLSEPSAAQSSRASSAPKAAGGAERTTKPGSVAVPLHAS